MSSNRCSEDSGGLDRPQNLDKAAVERSLQRRRILEELISTEEGYIGDVRFLMNVSCLRVGVVCFKLLKLCYRSTLRFSSPYLLCRWVSGPL